MRPLLVALAFCVPAAASAAPLTLTVRVRRGSKVYAHSEKAAAGQQTNYVGEIGERKVIVNANASTVSGGYMVQYQAEVSDPDEHATFQVQQSLFVRAGEPTRAVECGGWVVEVGVDAPTGAKAAPWTAASGNTRLTTTAGKRKCVLASAPDTQTNVIDTVRRKGFILNAVARQAGPSFKLEYQLESSPAVDSGEISLPLGVKTPSKGRKAQFLLEGRALPTATPAQGAAAPEKNQGDGAVPMLR